MSQATLSQGPYRNSNLFSGYYLDEQVYELDAWDCDAEAREAFEALSDLYETRKDALSSYDEAPLRNHWIDKVLEELGYETLEETPLVDARGSIDRTLYNTEDDQMTAAVMKADGEHTGMYGQSLSILEAKQWDADFTERFSDQRSYRDASHQIKSYLEHTPESVSWGILTNGKKWRLYGTNDYETETYYEVDLPELLESGSVEVFKYFYVFFRPAAFRESAGTTFLDTVWSESEIAAQELGEDLQDNVFTALRVLGEGFVETNDLDIDPTDDERLAELKEQSLVLLYRLMFVLYAESRGLIDPEDPNRRREYEENFSLGVLRQDIREKVGETPSEATFEREYSEYSFSMWNRLERLFSLVDTGNDDLGIPPYNGGLFDENQHEFLTEHEVANTYIAEVIYRLSTTATDEGFVPADYADLDTRHLGTIYEGLLEHEFAVAPGAQAAVAEDGGQVWKPADEVSVAEAVETVEQGELYVVNDEGERKATGAYYTPDYVVTYIVEETVGPLLSDIEAELAEMDKEPGTQEYVVAFWERVTDLKILDPAMGSGHFLTRATGYLADAVMEQVRKLESGSLFDEEWVRRKISRECIYGVDINGMAVELAKLSMWLETLAADQPLAFLDHHLKTGNSLVGSDITEVLADDEDELGQVTLAYDFAQTRRRALGQVMDNMSELLAIDNETLKDVHSMERIYDDIRADPLYEHLQAMATVHTASAFGLDVPEDAIERMARAIEDETAWADIEATDWFRAARAMADEEGFFHWELEFPAVFFDSDGERLASAGFDATVGNPPYVRPHNLDDSIKGALWELYPESYRAKSDILNCFIQFSIETVREHGNIGLITSDTWRVLSSAEGLREYILKTASVGQLGILPENVFQDASVETVLTFLSPESNEPARTDNMIDVFDVVSDSEIASIPQQRYDSDDDSRFFVLSPEEFELRDKVKSGSVELGEISDIDFGLKTGDDSRYLKEEQTEPEDRKLITSRNIQRYYSNWSGTYVWYVPDDMRQHRTTARPGEAERFEREKVVISRMSETPTSVVDRDSWYVKDALLAHTDAEYSHEYLCAILNSKLMDFYYSRVFQTLDVHRNELLRIPIQGIDLRTPDEETRQNSHNLDTLDIQEIQNGELRDEVGESDISKHEFLTQVVPEIESLVEKRNSLNLDLLDYLGTYADDLTLGEMDYQPPSGLSSSVLTETAESTDFETLRVTAARVERDGGDAQVLAVPYVKPTDEEEYETNSRGYATLNPVPAMEFFDLTDAQADLVETFVPYAVEEADGFAGYRDNATATISPLDRLEGLTLPALADVENGIEGYVERRERAAELDEQIERTDELIDEIVYELYGLTDEEIEIVEEVAGD
jgi:type I restriction-modification system DNA methylase subunit